ncbi:hypothetical protein [Microbacterium paraoxydans]|uniref:Uncharacterized protein n=1 Tax=Microbacterium paraoxydans TaxID=199592 RepID=A0A1H1LCD9_9MICO|nr:hypothetical protein [Microbacterium paraoxydans]SDR71695.1 hypothetical protein SAMN04489809_0056 [Microbacterium paraoxydans]SDT09154.1 hypothetical protein SAMN04489809_3491 [Microbacterium paraoxydans]
MIESIFFNPWIWIIPILMVVLVALTVVGGFALWRDDLSLWMLPTIISPFALLILGGFYFGAMLPPYDVSYYQTYRITGELTQVESAFNGDEGTMSQVFIARVDGVDLFIRSGDQRFRSLDAGDEVNLVCEKRFAYFQEPWFDCSFGGEQR